MLSRSQPQSSPDIPEKVTLLAEVLLNPDAEVLRRFSASGALGEMIPEWRRLTGNRNTQHSTHHYPLDEHTFTVVERTKSASYYQNLTQPQKFIAALGALLHDIDKNTGPERLRGKLPVDKLHPVKSAEMSRDILHRLGLPTQTIQRIYTLIHHHQSFGRLFIFYPQADVPRLVLGKIAMKIRHHGLLHCLLALSEGDIRGVQRQDAFFTPRVEDLLGDYAKAVQAEINTARSRLPLFPQHLALDASHQQIDLSASAAFVLSAPDWEALSGKLRALNWGGACILPYAHSLQGLHTSGNSCAAFIRFLPENLAYWGPKPLGFPAHEVLFPSMDVFYALYWGEPLKPAELTSLDTDILHACQFFQPILQDFLATVSQQQGYLDWAEAFDAYEAASFDPSSLSNPVFPLLAACSEAYQKRFPQQPCMGVGTRPILTGFSASTAAGPVDLPGWENLPVYRAE